MVEVVDMRGPGGVGGARFGELVHAVLAAIPLDARQEAIDGAADVYGRILAASGEEVRAAGDSVARVLAHPLLERARQAAARGTCRRETPVTLTLDDGTLVEGAVDLAFEESGTWTVVDYKTDRELTAGDERYHRQVTLYVAAIAKATGAVCRGVMVRV
jgi:ATP-dependent exoDNAse (exonuclease V) beta subunit